MTTQRTRALVLLITTTVAVGGSLALRGQLGGGRDVPVTASLDVLAAEIEAGRRTTPIIGEQSPDGAFRVTFLVKSRGALVPRIVSDVTGWGENVADNTFDFNIGRMVRIGGSGWYSLETRVAPGARIEYMVVHGREYALDPCNPRKTRIRGGGPASEFVTPGYVPPDDLATLPSVTAGNTVGGRIFSRALGGSRRVIVYTPPGYHVGGPYPMAVFEQGVRPVGRYDLQPDNHRVPQEPVIETSISPRLLDYLIATRAIEPLVVAFAESMPFGDTSDYSREAMRTFLSAEVPAWMAAHYAVSANARDRAILGISAGAREAVDAAIGPSTYGRVGLLIPGRRVALEPNLEEQIATVSDRRHVAILAGRYDQANLATAQKLRQAFAGAGDSVDFIMVAEGHNQATWHDHMSKVLIALFRPAAN